MASDYPTSVDNPTPIVDGADYVEAVNINTAYDAEVAAQTFIGASGAAQGHNTDLITQLAYAAPPMLTQASSSSISVSAGTVVVKKADGSIRKLRRNTSAVTVTAANLDTGSMADATLYYVHAVGDAAATTFTVVFSLSATSPTGVTSHQLIGWFWNEQAGALNVTSKFIGNYKGYGRDVPNVVTRYGTAADAIDDTTYGNDLTESSVRFYSSGRPVLVLFNLSGSMSTGLNLDLILDLDGSDQSDSEIFWGGTGTGARSGAQMSYVFTPSAGSHLYTIQAKVNVGTYTVSKKRLQVIEL